MKAGQKGALWPKKPTANSISKRRYLPFAFAPLVLLDESQIKDLIYEARGQKVMLDFDLARIYGYGTSAFDQQIKGNLDRFPRTSLFN